MLRHVLALVLALPASAGDVLVVDPAGGAGSSFTTIQAAVDAAEDGDLVLVRSGTYAESVHIDAVSLSLIADAGADVQITPLGLGSHPALRVTGLAPLQRVVLRGVHLEHGDAFPVDGTLTLQGCAGPVFVEDVEATAPHLTFSQLGSVLVEQSSQVVFTRLVASSFMPTMALRDGSTVSIYESDIEQLDNGTTVSVEGSDLFVSGSKIRGADGTVDTLCFGSLGEDGGNAVVLDQGASVKLLDTDLLPGMGSCHPCSGHCGAVGAAVSGFGDTDFLPGQARQLTTTSPVRDGEVLVATHAGKPGDLVVTLYSSELGPTPFVPEARGPIVPSILSLGLASVGTIPAGGTLTTMVPVSFPLPGFAEVFVQDVRITPVGNVVVSNPSAVVYLGPGL